MYWCQLYNFNPNFKIHLICVEGLRLLTEATEVELGEYVGKSEGLTTDMNMLQPNVDTVLLLWTGLLATLATTILHRTRQSAGSIQAGHQGQHVTHTAQLL